ncbi:MAG: beta-N-acetylhexosaminidase [Alistipes sp.]
MKNLYLSFAAVVGCCACTSQQPTTTGIIPVPQQVEWRCGQFERTDTLYYTSNLEAADQADLEAWMATAPIALIPAVEDEQATLTLSRTGKGEQAGESYTLDVDRKRIAITAAETTGLFYGLQSLMQLADNFGYCIPRVRIEDAPRFGYRGMMLDVSRNFRSKEFIKRQMDLMARYKLNRFHWHLTDGAGWRIEIKSHPELTEMAAWRPYADWAAWQEGGRRYCRRDDPKAQGGYYTQDEIREVVEYARQCHITVIPEIEMPGHSEEVLAVYPALSCSGKAYVDSDLCIGNEAVYTLLTDVLTEVMELFPSEYIHIGGDEASKRSWATCPKCQALMQREGMHSTDELQSYLVHRIEQFLNAHGRNLLGWDEILQGGLAPNATVMSWRGIEGGIEAARQGHHAVMTPGTYCYLDYCQDDPTREPAAAAAFVTLRTAYSYDPAPDSLEQACKAMILGVQGNLWCEHVATDDHAEHMLWPRMLAIAEVGWSLPERKDYDDFHARALQAVTWMQERGHTPFDLKNEVGARPESQTTISSLATGKKVIYNTPYSPKYAAAGDSSLTDGIRGDWNYGDHRWLGWLDTDVDVVVDLGAVQTIRHIAADFMQGFYADIWMPRAVEFALSDDQITYQPLATADNTLPFDFKQTAYRNFGWTGTASGRYVRMTARSNGHAGGWLFTDEIIIE